MIFASVDRVGRYFTFTVLHLPIPPWASWSPRRAARFERVEDLILRRTDDGARDVTDCDRARVDIRAFLAAASTLSAGPLVDEIP